MLILLGHVAARSAMLTIACSRCERRGRYRTAALVERHGAGMTIAELLEMVSATCPKRVSPTWYDRCDPHCPDLSRLFMP